MTAKARRIDPGVLDWIRCVVVAGSVFAGLHAMGVGPVVLSGSLAVIAGVLAYLSEDAGSSAAVVVLSIPLLAVSPLVGVAAAIIGVAAVRYMGGDGGRTYLVVVAAVGGAFLGPAWTAVALAGFLLGAGEAMVVAVLAFFLIESIGVLSGMEAVGAVVTGGAIKAVDLRLMPGSLLDLSWLGASFSTLGAGSVDLVMDAFADARHGSLLMAQPLLWAAGAGVTSLVARQGRRRGNLPLTLGSLPLGVAIPAAGVYVMAAGIPALSSSQVVWAAASSVLAAVLVGWAYERFVVREESAEAAGSPSKIHSDDADVDELLTLIATAEDRLAAEHTTHRTVMITDMKSFASMTEEDGSMNTAKAIQRHRDLLLPVIERHGGKGKSTGGDGLIAAFEDPDEALGAAVEIQQVLAKHNDTHPAERDLSVRVGLASGEVVLDKRGRPFIGSAINLAARIMNLADGGQSFAESSLTGSGCVSARSLGMYELKNISRPVEVSELLWAGGAAGSSPVLEQASGE